MISPETRVQIRRYFYAEHWKIGTIARELNVHPDAVRNAIESDRFNRTQPMRPCNTDLTSGEEAWPGLSWINRTAVLRSWSGVRPPDPGSTSATAGHAHSSDDPGSRLQRQHNPAASRRGQAASSRARTVPETAGIPRRTLW